jgi:prevent-host-death family protein
MQHGGGVRKLSTYKLNPDLVSGVLPIAAAASRLAQLLKETREGRCVFVVTQKGYPQAVIMDVELFQLLAQLAGEEVALKAAEATD